MEFMENNLVASVVYSLMGVVVFAIAFFVMEKLAPFSLKKELSEDDNVAVGIVLASVVIGLAMIISSAIGA
jgi:putative membrane protein